MVRRVFACCPRRQDCGQICHDAGHVRRGLDWLPGRCQSARPVHVLYQDFGLAERVVLKPVACSYKV
jgi:hypothetical protein